ncbi:conjugal transfer protein [Rhizobium sp. VS19-DR104.2]|uniref:TrbM/KikA/MpfK family conjugal transfer protein n=1 Tax=Rhizobium/Agrobacterium group TaxID=227290 RepID=UPI001CC5F184|nr:MULTISPECIES: TrbM/KikA/MpfK family conjugal transfer protein [unclassified Rhizobium]MBZ5763329.1 conjugal transfer protein [Rhizobium sp. VS19-DR96]MBZ5769224.1 conjugal transfer protein [Rhizobium sp. VS19-DR129.2]MBZ5776781.1 conjugal transfer protein [Rhizobium sp. VS19-DRK62.2]MBZ5788199.1 conjugal transfer protein [Rhizobium sp. VS19-DR121]MBZ5805282.1 conjugal transfer protein [Rhizobium sp. VS19-DR181]
MKHALLFSVLVLAGGSIATTAQAKDPCQTLICMAGMAASGSTSGGCDNAVSDFFSINVFKHGNFRKSATSDARKEFLNQCPGADNNQSQVSSIISAFGTMRR